MHRRRRTPSPAFLPALRDLQSRLPGLVRLDLVVSAVAGSMVRGMLADLDVGPAADMLAKYVPPGARTRAISASDRGRVATGHQIEAAVGEGHWGLLAIGDHDDAERVEQRPRLGEVGRPSLGGHQRRREALRSGAGEHLPAAGLDVQRRGRRRELLGEETLIAPRRALLRRAAVEPRESQPSTGTAAASSTSSSNVLTTKPSDQAPGPLRIRLGASPSGNLSAQT